MSLVTRGLGKSQKLVTGGLGGVSILQVFTGKIIYRTLELSSFATKKIGLVSISERLSNLASSLSKNSSLHDVSRTSNLDSESIRDLSCRP